MIGYSGGLDFGNDQFRSLSASYQWRIGNGATFFSLGLSSYEFKNVDDREHTVNGVSANRVQKTSKKSIIMPVISFDRRF